MGRTFLKLGRWAVSKGALIAELAIVFPLVLLLTLATIDLVQLSWLKSAVQSGLTEGIKYSEGIPELQYDLWGDKKCQTYLVWNAGGRIGGAGLPPGYTGLETYHSECPGLESFEAARVQVESL